MRILIADDDRLRSTVCEHTIRRLWPDADIDLVSCATDAITALRGGGYDLCITDLVLTGDMADPGCGTGYDVVDAAKLHGQVPTLVVTDESYIEQVPHASAVVHAQDFATGELFRTLERLSQHLHDPTPPTKPRRSGLLGMVLLACTVTAAGLMPLL